MRKTKLFTRTELECMSIHELIQLFYDVLRELNTTTNNNTKNILNKNLILINQVIANKRWENER